MMFPSYLKGKRWLPSLAALLCYLLSAIGASAQDNRWDLQRCINYASENNLQLKITRLNEQTNEANLIQALANRYPNLSAGANQSWNYGRSIDQFTNQFTTQEVLNVNLQAGSNLTIFNGFRINNAIKQTRMQLESSQFDSQQARNELMLNILNTYLQILFNQELLNVARLQLENTKEQLERTTVLIDAGAAPEANKYDIIAQQADDENRIITAENNLTLAIVRLKLLLQLPIETPFEVVIPELEEPQASDLIVSASEIFEIAQGTQPQVLSADKRVEAAQIGVELARGNYYPTISAFASVVSGYSSQIRIPTEFGVVLRDIGFLTDNPSQRVSSLVSVPIASEKKPFRNQLEENFRQGYGFSMQIPIFNRLQTRNQVATSLIQTDRARLDAMNVRNTLRQNIEQAHADAKAAQRSFVSNKTNLDALERSLKVVEERFNAGAANSLDYALAKNRLNIAQSQMIQAKYDYIFRMKVLDFYAGKELRF